MAETEEKVVRVSVIANPLAGKKLSKKLLKLVKKGHLKRKRKKGNAILVLKLWEVF